MYNYNKEQLQEMIAVLVQAKANLASDLRSCGLCWHIRFAWCTRLRRDIEFNQEELVDLCFLYRGENTIIPEGFTAIKDIYWWPKGDIVSRIQTIDKVIKHLRLILQA